MLRLTVCVFGSVLLVSATLGAQAPPPAASQRARPNVLERPWTNTPGSPYDRAQAVAAERVRPTTPSIDFPVVDAPPGELPATALPAAAGAAVPGASGRPNVLQRPWTDDPGSPHGRAQAVAAERGVRDGRLQGASPYPDKYRSPVPTPFRPQSPRSRWRGGVIYPALPFPPIDCR